MNLVRHESNEPERLENDKLIKVGQWYWVKGEKYAPWLGCLVHIGSNYVELKAYHMSTRVHLDDFSKVCRVELNPRAVIAEKVNHHRGEVERLMGDINKLTGSLGVAPTLTIEHNENTRALSTLNEQVDVNKYKKQLIKAKDTDLPKLFSDVRENSEKMSVWLSYEVIPWEAALDQMRGSVGVIQDRIFHVDLYAGLSEKVVHAAEGEPAPSSETLHVMQRRLYMDEESLAEYKSGGMDCRNLGDFDKWLAKKENLNRLLPFPRCMVAFRVRRDVKDREEEFNIFIKISMAEADKWTFLYIRNGDNLYRMNAELEFGEKIFPDTSEFDSREPLMAKMSGGDADKIITKREYDAMAEQFALAKREHAAWIKANKGKRVKKYSNSEELREVNEHDSPHYWDSQSHRYDLDRYVPFNQSSVYYDDIRDKIAADIKQYNRIALIIQGLFDRSQILHPHGRVSLWTAEGFAAAVTLVLDSDRTLHPGEAPDFEVYRAQCNEAFKPGALAIGQQLVWEMAEAVKENTRRANSWRNRRREGEREHRRFTPYGNPGPGFVARVVTCTRTTCTFVWARHRLTRSRYGNEPSIIPVSFTAKKSDLLCVDGYKPGDFKKFFSDPRTRADYLQWAPYLLGAEEAQAGMLKVGEETLSTRRKRS